MNGPFSLVSMYGSIGPVGSGMTGLTSSGVSGAGSSVLLGKTRPS